MNGLVSIIMPNYNCGGFVSETVNSVLAQTYTDWELLIVDDCSTDNSVEVIKSLSESDDRIKLFISERNGGAAAARNRALREAKGKWIAFLDSDDLWTADKLEKQIDFMEKNGYKFSFTRYMHIDENSEPIGIEVTGPEKLTKRKMRRCCYPGCLTVMYDAETVGLIQIPDEIGNGENDYAIWLEAVKKADCYYLDEILAKYRVRGNSLSHKASKSKLMHNFYVLHRVGEKRGAFVSALATFKNSAYTVFKKMHFVKRKKERRK